MSSRMYGDNIAKEHIRKRKGKVWNSREIN